MIQQQPWQMQQPQLAAAFIQPPPLLNILGNGFIEGSGTVAVRPDVATFTLFLS
jgi:hypothetical protein